MNSTFLFPCLSLTFFFYFIFFVFYEIPNMLRLSNFNGHFTLLLYLSVVVITWERIPFPLESFYFILSLFFKGTNLR